VRTVASVEFDRLWCSPGPPCNGNCGFPRSIPQDCASHLVRTVTSVESDRLWCSPCLPCDVSCGFPRIRPQDSASHLVRTVASREADRLWWSLNSHTMGTLALPGAEVKEIKKWTSELIKSGSPTSFKPEEILHKAVLLYSLRFNSAVFINVLLVWNFSENLLTHTLQSRYWLDLHLYKRIKWRVSVFHIPNLALTFLSPRNLPWWYTLEIRKIDWQWFHFIDARLC
jgi:hypothetical protein